jgi:OmpA-OmpF porin, OOP family
MKFKAQAIAAVACGLLLAPMTHAAENEGGYWTDPDGDVYRNGLGECWKNPGFTKADAIEECDPELIPEPEPKPVVERAPAPVPQPIERRVTLDADTYFAYDKSKLSPAGARVVTRLAREVKGIRDLTIHIGGHTDSIASEAYNQELSIDRAQAVKDQFVESGIDPGNIAIQGYGETVPLVSNATPLGRSKNRRADITITGIRMVMP